MGSAQSGIAEDNANNSQGLKRFSSILTQVRQNQDFQQLILSAIKQSKNQAFPVINSPDLEEFQKFFNESNGDVEKFFDLIQERISDLYINLSKQTLELMCEKKLQSTQGKIFISQQILYTSINILKTIGMRTSFKYDTAIINRLNSLQLAMLGYMKAKYPRQSQNFVPGQLMHEFKNFDFVQQPQNDVLRHLKICFGQFGEDELKQQVNKFINHLIVELDNNYPRFQKLLSEKVFVVTKEGQSYTVQNMIGRKIPENVDKMNEDVDAQIDLKSPEIFRVIVKWVSDMEDYILHPDDELKEKDYFKVVKQSENQLVFDYISTDELQNSLPTLQELLMKEKGQYQKELRNVKNHIELFNHNLIKILAHAERNEKYVPKKEAEIIKYSMFNKKLLSWMVIQKLVVVLSKLVKTAKNFEENCGMKLDLVKFNVTDLLRARMSGNKYEILKVWLNLKNLQNQGKIKILKIKNRLQTPMNDAMLIFKMSDSFIICQLQLILMESNQSFTQKLKNIETLNHFFYELQRSSYGVMAELASLLSFKDNKTNFEGQITFKNITEYSLQKCTSQHPNQVEKQTEQKKPFICSKCTQFYGEYQNTYIYHHCKVCNQYECIKCLIQAKKYEETILRNEAIENKIKHVLQELAKVQKEYVLVHSSDNYRLCEFANEKSNVQQTSNIIKVNNLRNLREIAKKKNVITFKQIQKYLQQYQYYQDTYLSICKFVGKELKYYLLYYDKFKTVGFCFDYGLTHPDKFMHFGYFDFLSVIQTKAHQNSYHSISSYSHINFFANYSLPKQITGRQTAARFIPINIKKQIVPICQVVLDMGYLYHLSDRQNSDQSFKKQFSYQSIEELRKNIPSFVQALQRINLSNQGITSDLLTYFKNVEWRGKIKFLNLHDNKIEQISVILSELLNIETLIISKNEITELKFEKKLLNIKKIVASNNLIQTFEGIQCIQNISILKMASNHLQTFPLTKIPLPNLRQLDLSYNQLTPFQKIDDKFCPKLMSLNLCGSTYQQQQCDFAFQIELPKLKICILKYFSIKSLQIRRAINLQHLDLEQMRANNFTLEEARNLKHMNINNCFNTQAYEINEVDTDQNKFMRNILSKQFPQLNFISLHYCWQIGDIPVLKMPQLKNMKVFGVSMNNISNFSGSSLQNLQQLMFYGVSIDSLPVLDLPKVETIQISSSTIQSVLSLEQWKVPNLKKITLSTINKQSEIVSFSNLPCTEISIFGGKFREGLLIENDKIKVISINSVNCEHFPVFKMKNLDTLSLTSCEPVNLGNLENCQMEKLVTLQGYNLVLKPECKFLPVLKYPSLQTLKLLAVGLEDVSNLSLCELPNLHNLDFGNNNFRKFPQINCPKLERIQLKGCLIEDMSGLSTSNLPQLNCIQCSDNKFQEIPILKFPKLTHLYMHNNGITDIKNLALSILPKLKQLTLTGVKNQISSIPANLNLPELQNISLQISSLKNIQGFTNCLLTKMKQLYLTNVKLTNPKLPKLHFPQLATLDISGSNINDLSNLQHSFLPKLTTFHLQQSQVKELPVMKFPDLVKIKACNTAENKKNKKCLFSIQNLSNSDLPKLESLEFESNEIDYLPRMKFPKLSTIFLTDNNIKSVIDFKKSKLPNFKLINIYENKITQMPIGKQVKPTSLYMKNAELINFDQLVQYAPFFQNFYYNESLMPASWPKCSFKKVKIFQIMKCSLTNIDHIMKNPFEQVIELSFTGNQIVNVPQIFCPKLKKLYFNMNSIKNVKQFMKSKLPAASMISFQTNQIEDMVDFPFQNVDQVFLSHNLFSDISFMSKYSYSNMKMIVLFDIKLKKLCKLKAPNVTKIYMNMNLIQNLNDMRGSQLPSLNLFQLGDNRITDVSALNEMRFQKIQNIYLMNNKLTKLCKINLPSLIMLNLNGNPISNVDEFLQVKLPQLKSLYLCLDQKQPAKTENFEKVYKIYEYRVKVSYYGQTDED